MKIKEVIVVEGKNDANKIKSIVDCDVIETSGTHLSKQVMKTLKLMQEKRGIIVFSDPDYPGEYIRNKINAEIPGVKHAFIQKDKAKTSKKVGVEHASKEDILEALQHLLTYHEIKQESLSYKEYMELGFVGFENSAKLREMVGNILFVGKCNAKTLFKRINMLGLNKEDVEKVMEELYE